MRAYINLITNEITPGRPLDPYLLLDMTVEEAEDGRDEFDRSVEVMLLVPPGTLLKVALAPQPLPGQMN